MQTLELLNFCAQWNGYIRSVFGLELTVGADKVGVRLAHDRLLLRQPR